MTSPLIDRILDLADKATSLDDEHRELLLAALLDELDAALEGALPARPEPAPKPEAEDRDAALAYLRSIEVQGFRGIGARSKLEIEPGCGLTRTSVGVRVDRGSGAMDGATPISSPRCYKRN